MKITFTHTWQSNIGWIGTALLEEDFVNIDLLGVMGNSKVFHGTMSNGQEQILKGNYTKHE